MDLPVRSSYLCRLSCWGTVGISLGLAVTPDNPIRPWRAGSHCCALDVVVTEFCWPHPGVSSGAQQRLRAGTPHRDVCLAALARGYFRTAVLLGWHCSGIAAEGCNARERIADVLGNQVHVEEGGHLQNSKPKW